MTTTTRLPALSARQIRMLAAIGRRGTVLLIDPELLGPWTVGTRAALERRGLVERSADGWEVGITHLGRRWLNLDTPGAAPADRGASSQERSEA